jgi:CRP-like cAMP-binding protein
MITLEEDGRALTDAERIALRQVVAAEGVPVAARLLHTSAATIARALAYIPITRESVARLRTELQKKGYIPRCPPTP